MKMKARSGIIIWCIVIALFAGTAAFAATFKEFDSIGGYLLVLIILAASTALTASFVVRNYLFVTEQEIRVCFGMTTTVLKMASISSLKKVTTLTASASASVKRIEIRYDGGIIYVSPKDEDKFIQTVCSYHPELRYIEQGESEINKK